MFQNSFMCPGCDKKVLRLGEEDMSDKFISELLNELVDLNCDDPIELLRFLQTKLVKGRQLYIPDIAQYEPDGDDSVNYISVNRE